MEGEELGLQEQVPLHELLLYFVVLSAVFWGEGVGEYMGMFLYVQVQVCVHTCKG